MDEKVLLQAREEIGSIDAEMAALFCCRMQAVGRVAAYKKDTGMPVFDGARERGVDTNRAEKLFDDMISFANYAFNKSHAAAYSIISYRTAYLKAHYPKEYFTLEKFQVSTGYLFWPGAPSQRNSSSLLPKRRKNK